MEMTEASMHIYSAGFLCTVLYLAALKMPSEDKCLLVTVYHSVLSQFIQYCYTT
jgi:hypothetical protein